MENPQLNPQSPDALIRAMLKATEPEALRPEAYARMQGAVQAAVRPPAPPLPVRPLLPPTAWWGVGILAVVLVGLGLWLPGPSPGWQPPLPSPPAMRLALILCLTAWSVLAAESRLRHSDCAKAAPLQE